VTEKTPHSFDILSDNRDYWWSPDYLALLAERYRFHEVESMLDVGCGMSHWGHLLVPHLSPDAQVYGIDPERVWVDSSIERANEKGFGSRAHYQVGRVEALPYPNDHFDMVTCQTVLIHVDDLTIAIREMLRVLKPGGLFAVAEPNNLAAKVVLHNLNYRDPVEEIVSQVRFWLYCERGREALGRGNFDRGDIIPTHLHRSGVEDIQVHISDLAGYLIPPYDTPRERMLLSDLNADLSEYWDDLEHESRKAYLAGGGTLALFQKSWDLVIKNRDRLIKGLNDKTLCSTGGFIMYFISGRKPL